MLRIWRPVRQVTFGRRDARSDGFETAKRLAHQKGFPPVERRVGGRAVAHTGGTVAFALAVPTTGIRTDITDRYDRVVQLLTTTFRDLGAAVKRGEPPNAYCPGSHSIRVVDGGKVAGIAQRVRRDAALVSGCLTVCRRDVAATVDVLDPVYDALGVAFDPGAVGCLADAGGPSSPGRAAAAIEAALSTEPWHDSDQ
ncbi:Biotin/lipoate A/B protein ligase family protein [Halopenitus malekzadehii]|uniref:Biotin/lipoate A/B protein ligase family protein n=2 Tax=Halopenitus malekzadehii TaxID=1267564 RepID=A0A1H6IZZ2_9EURY|nr:Biotin/lipoate A/B protein ligase family protein [Halopenitus malekzadehii]